MVKKETWNIISDKADKGHIAAKLQKFKCNTQEFGIYPMVPEGVMEKWENHSFVLRRFV